MEAISVEPDDESERLPWRRALVLLAIGVLVQMITLGATTLLVPSTGGILTPSGPLMAYMFLTQWIAYLVSFPVIWLVTRSAFETVVLVLATLGIVWAGIILNDRYATWRRLEEARESAEFVDERSDSTRRIVATTMANVARSVHIETPEFRLECPRREGVTKGAGGTVRTFAAAILVVPLKVSEPGEYQLDLHWRYFESGLPIREGSVSDGYTFSVSEPGAYSVEWPLDARDVGGPFVEWDHSVLSLQVYRLATTAELFPTIANRRSSWAHEKRRHFANETEFTLTGLSATRGEWWTPCSAPMEPRLSRP